MTARGQYGAYGISDGGLVVGGAIAALVVAVNGASAIAPWYRYGLMRERVASVAAPSPNPVDDHEHGAGAHPGHADEVALTPEAVQDTA